MCSFFLTATTSWVWFGITISFAIIFDTKGFGQQYFLNVFESVRGSIAIVIPSGIDVTNLMAMCSPGNMLVFLSGARHNFGFKWSFEL